MASEHQSLEKSVVVKAQPRQIQLLKQEEEELWISEEELCTDGSSDEESKKKMRQHKVEDLRRKAVQPSTSSANLAFKEDEISWLPKRGSIQLPLVDEVISFVDIKMSDVGDGFCNNQDYIQVPEETAETGQKEISIIEKNKSLAKCGRGVLSLTDNEDNRLNEILDENIDESAKWFLGNRETQDRLKQIDELLTNVAPDRACMTKPEKIRPISKRARLRKVNKKLDSIKKMNEEGYPSTVATEMFEDRSGSPMGSYMLNRSLIN